MLEMLLQNAKDTWEVMLWPYLKFAFQSFLGWFGIELGGTGGTGGGAGWPIWVVHIGYALLLWALWSNLQIKSFRRGDSAGERAKKTFKLLLWLVYFYSFPVVNAFLLDNGVASLVFSLITASFAAAMLLLKMLCDVRRRDWSFVPMLGLMAFAVIKNFIVLDITTQLVWAQIQALLTALVLWGIARHAVTTKADDERFETWLHEYPAEIEAYNEKNKEKLEERERKRKERDERLLREVEARAEAYDRELNMSPDERAWRDRERSGVPSYSRKYRARATDRLSDAFTKEICSNCKYYNAKENQCAYSYQHIYDPDNTTCRGFDSL